MSDIRVVASRRFGTLSPLRYPGGKASLAGFFSDIFATLPTKPSRYVEPYAGGAGAAIALLRENKIDEIVINDIDPAVNAFWHGITTENERFAERVETVPLTIEEWRKQRDTYRCQTAPTFDRGFAFFYLNRTNRSGILHAGVIGGQAQQGNYLMDARFNRVTLAGRIRAIGRLSDRITVTRLDGRTVINAHNDDPAVFLYIDPPYVAAGSQLYLNAFKGRDHIALAKIVNNIKRAHWLITYDIAPLIEKLYTNHFSAKLDLSYSAHHTGRAEELLICGPSIATALTTSTQGAVTVG